MIRIGLAVFIAVFTVYVQASRRAVDTGTRRTQIPLSRWTLHIEKVSLNNKEVVMISERWPLYTDPAAVQYSIMINKYGDLTLPKGTTVTVKTESNLVGFRNEESRPSDKPLQIEFSADGVIENAFLKSVVNARIPYAGPAPQLAKAMAQAALMRDGVIAPQQYRANNRGKEIGLYIDEVGLNSLSGHPKEISIPIEYKLSVNGNTFLVQGNFVLGPRARSHTLYITRSVKPDEEKLEKRRTYEAACRSAPTDVLGKKYCAQLSYSYYEEPYTTFFYSGWANPQSTDATTLEKLKSVENMNGTRLLSSLLPQMCSKRERRPVVWGAPPIPPDASIKALETLKLSVDDINYTDDYGMAAIHYALYHGCEKEADWLLSHGARLDVLTPEGKRSLGYAIAGGSRKYIDLLLDKTKPEDLSYPQSKVWASSFLEGVDVLSTAVALNDAITLRKIFLKKPTLDTHTLNIMISNAMSNRFTATLRAIIESGYIDAEYMTYVAGLARQQEARYTPDMRAEFSEYYKYLSALAAKAPKSVEYKPAKKDYKKGDTVLIVDINIEFFKTLSARTMRASYDGTKATESDSYMTETKTDWKAVLKDNKDKSINSAYLIFEDKHATNNMTEVQHVRLVYKDKPLLSKIEIFHKGKKKKEIQLKTGDPAPQIPFEKKSVIFLKFRGQGDGVLNSEVSLQEGSAEIGEDYLEYPPYVVLVRNPRNEVIERASTRPVPNEAASGDVTPAYTYLPLSDAAESIEIYSQPEDGPIKKIASIPLVTGEMETLVERIAPEATKKSLPELKLSLKASLVRIQQSVDNKKFDIAQEIVKKDVVDVIKTSFLPDAEKKKYYLSYGSQLQAAAKRMQRRIENIRDFNDPPAKVKGNTYIEVTGYADSNMKKLSLKAEAKDDADIYDEVYAPGYDAYPQFRLVAVDAKGKVREERKIGFKRRGSNNSCISWCPKHLFSRLHVKMKYMPDIVSIRLLNGERIVQESPIQQLSSLDPSR